MNNKNEQYKMLGKATTSVENAGKLCRIITAPYLQCGASAVFAAVDRTRTQ